MVGQPTLFEIGPTTLDNNRFIVLYIQGLKRSSKIKVVYKVYRHLSEDFGEDIYI